MDNKICFNCGTEYIGKTSCPNCGYLYSIQDSCPLKGFGNICQSTHKFCVRGTSDYLGCEILINQ